MTSEKPMSKLYKPNRFQKGFGDFQEREFIQHSMTAGNYRFNISSPLPQSFKGNPVSKIHTSSNYRAVMLFPQPLHAKDPKHVTSLIKTSQSSSRAPSTIFSWHSLNNPVNRSYSCPEGHGVQTQVILENRKTEDSSLQYTKLLLIESCFGHLGLKKSDNLEVCTSEKETILDQISRISPDEIIALSIKSQVDSKRVQTFLETFKYDAMPALIELIKTRVDEMIRHCYGCYILRTLLDCSNEFASFVSRHCLKHLSLLILDKNAVKVLQSLARVSNEFCTQALRFFEQNYFQLIEIVQCGLVLNKLIHHAPEENQVTFMLEKLEACLLNKKQVQVLRVLSSLVCKCTGVNLARLFLILKPHLSWLLNDRFGSFVAIKLLEKRVDGARELLISHLIDDPIGTLVRRVRMVVLLEALSLPEAEKICCKLLDKLSLDQPGSDKLFNTVASCQLLLAVLITASQRQSVIKRFHSKLAALEYLDPHSDSNHRIKSFMEDFLQLGLAKAQTVCSHGTETTTHARHNQLQPSTH